MSDSRRIVLSRDTTVRVIDADGRVAYANLGDLIGYIVDQTIDELHDAGLVSQADLDAREARWRDWARIACPEDRLKVVTK